MLIYEITITPNSLKKKESSIIVKSMPHKFSFGKEQNCDCELGDSTISAEQFFIYYNKDTKNFNVLDNPIGTGHLFKLLLLF